MNSQKFGSSASGERVREQGERRDDGAHDRLEADREDRQRGAVDQQLGLPRLAPAQDEREQDQAERDQEQQPARGGEVPGSNTHWNALRIATAAAIAASSRQIAERLRSAAKSATPATTVGSR